MKKHTLLSLLICLSAITLAQDIKISFTGSGQVSTVDSVQVKNISNCSVITVSGNSLFNINTATGIYDLTSIQNGRVNSYPNPFNNSTEVNFNIPQNQNINIFVSDISGKQISSLCKELNEGNHRFKFTPAKSGIYILKLFGKNFQTNTKVICTNSSVNKASLSYLSSEPVSFSSANKQYDAFSFNNGDMLKLTAYSGNHSSVIVDAPVSSKAYNFEFRLCEDYDGNNYPSVQIGNQIWMSKNLNTTHFSDGRAITHFETNDEWESMIIETPAEKAYCYLNNNIDNEAQNYGALYTCTAASDGQTSYDVPSGNQGVCPTGWHIPSSDEWEELFDFAGGIDNVYLPLINDCSSNILRTQRNETGFSAMNGGYRSEWGNFHLRDAYYWSTSYSSPTSAMQFRIIAAGGSPSTAFISGSQSDGASVRCIQD